MTIRKTADWLLSWVYDSTDGGIYTGHDHIDIVPHIPNYMEKMMDNDLICGWYVKDWGDVTTRIATDTVDQEHADKNSPIADAAQKAAMKYWHENGLNEEYDEGDYCDRCGEYVGDINDHNDYYHPREYCEHCDEYYNPEHQDHSDPYCDRCWEHVNDLDEHNDTYHFTPEPWMPKEGEKITYKGNEYKVLSLNGHGILIAPWLPGGMTSQSPSSSWILPFEDYQEDKNQQQGWTETHPDQLDFSNVNPYLWQDYFLNKQPTSKIAHYSDLHDREVFAKLSKDYISFMSHLEARLAYDPLTDTYEDGSTAVQRWLAERAGADPDDYVNQMEQKNDWTDADDKGADISQGLAPEQTDTETDFTPTPGDDTPTAETKLPDNPKVVDIARDWDSEEYRWSYDGTTLHMWRVFNRSAYGPSHYDMFGHDGYSNHSQGRVYVGEDGKIGMLYWQITHPECERVLNEWCIKTFGRLPDYTYRAYGPYQGKPVSRWDFPIVEVSGLPIAQRERWWEQPGGYPGMKPTPQPDYPSKKQKKKFQIIPGGAPGPTDDQGEPINPSKNKRRKRTRNRKYRNRSFRGR